jgi:acetyltransferase-like isoleucine patch superfamily enzyme
MSLISALFTDLRKPSWRFLVLQEMLRMIPGEFGFEIRAWLLGRRFKQAGPGLRLFPGTRLFGVEHLKVGSHCWIGLDNTIQAHGGVEIGDHVLLGPGVKIWSVNHVFADSNRPIIDQGYEHKPVIIGSNVWIGANAFVMPGAHIGDGVIVSAGSVVGAKFIEPYSVIAGNPARRIGSRNTPSNTEEPVAVTSG